MAGPRLRAGRGWRDTPPHASLGAPRRGRVRRRGRLRRARGRAPLSRGWTVRRRARGPRPRRRAGVDGAAPGRHADRPGRRLARPWAGPAVRARHGDGRRHVSNLRRRRQPPHERRPPPPLPRARPPRPRVVRRRLPRRRDAAHRRDGPLGPARRAVDGPRRRGTRCTHDRQLDRLAAERSLANGARHAPHDDGRPLHLRPLGGVAPLRALPSPLGRRVPEPDQHRGRRAAGSCGGRHAGDRGPHRGAARRRRPARDAGAGDPPDGVRRGGRRRPGDGARRARRRGHPAHARGPRPLRAEAPGRACAPPATPSGRLHLQDRARLRRAVLARRRSLGRVARARLRPLAHDRRVRSHGTARHPQHVRLRTRRAGARAARSVRATSSGRRRDDRALRPEGGEGPRLRGAGLGRGGMDARLLHGPLGARSPDAVRAPPPRARRAHPLGRHGDLTGDERLHRRRRTLGRARGGRGARGGAPPARGRVPHRQTESALGWRIRPASSRCRR